MVIKKTMSTVAKWVGLMDKLATYQEVEREFLKHHPDADVTYLKNAYAFAEEAHQGQKRNSGEPYIYHPVAVALLLAENSLDMETVAAGFLHDVIEDCEVEPAELEKRFGKDLLALVDGVTKIGSIKFRDKHEAKAENYRKMIMAIAQDIRVLIIKLADRCHNMRTLDALHEGKRKKISQETLDIYTPLAHRIGMGHFKNILESLAFLHLEPGAYNDLSEQLKQREKTNDGFMERCSHALDALLKEHQINAEVSSRVKSVYSIYKKMKRKNCGLEGLYDYYAFRIITDSVEACYKIFGLLHGHWNHIPGRIKDFIATPKTNLYQSIHTTLMERGQPFEVQVRTKFMHRISEEGVAAHWTYKNGRLLSLGKSDYVAWLRRLADDQNQVQDTDEFLTSIKGQLKTKDILVFTPMSEIKTLPEGSTPLDFAYLIHTEVGHHAVGAKVDGKMVSLRSELRSGSIVEILTDKKQTPNEERLQFVKSHSARTKILSWLRIREREKAIEMGRTFFEKELRKRKLPVKSITNLNLQEKLSEMGFKKVEEFYAAIGFGNLTPRKAVRFFAPEQVDREDEEIFYEGRIKKALKRVRKPKQTILVKGHDDILVNRAKCCNPIMGDPIVGYITRGQGVTVHRKDCRSFTQQNMNPERRIEVDWDSHVENHDFSVRLRIFTEDRPGMIAAVTAAIANTKTDVLSLSASIKDSLGLLDIVLKIDGIHHLKKVYTSLRKIKGVLNFERLT